MGKRHDRKVVEAEVVRLICKHIGVRKERVGMDRDIIDDLGGRETHHAQLIKALNAHYGMDTPYHVGAGLRTAQALIEHVYVGKLAGV